MITSIGAGFLSRLFSANNAQMGLGAFGELQMQSRGAKSRSHTQGRWQQGGRGRLDFHTWYTRTGLVDRSLTIFRSFSVAPWKFSADTLAHTSFLSPVPPSKWDTSFDGSR